MTFRLSDYKNQQGSILKPAAGIFLATYRLQKQFYYISSRYRESDNRCTSRMTDGPSSIFIMQLPYVMV